MVIEPTAQGCAGEHFYNQPNNERQTMNEAESNNDDAWTRHLTMEWLGGATWQRFASRDMTLYALGWRNETDSHVYTVTIERRDAGWTATLQNDGREVWAMAGTSRWTIERCAYAAAVSYLMRGHRRARRAWKASQGLPTAYDGAAGTGAFFTPPEVMDIVTANPPTEADDEAHE
jgi:hypothetical protein